MAPETGRVGALLIIAAADPNERGYDVIRRLFLLEFARIAEQLR